MSVATPEAASHRTTCKANRRGTTVDNGKEAPPRGHAHAGSGYRLDVRWLRGGCINGGRRAGALDILGSAILEECAQLSIEVR